MLIAERKVELDYRNQLDPLESRTLRSLDKPSLAALWCELNIIDTCNRPPAALREYFPANWHCMTQRAAQDFVWPYMTWISNHIGHDVCMATWRRITKCRR